MSTTSPNVTAPSSTLTFQRIDNPTDLTFNQLLAINNAGTIAGYYGNDLTPAHPNKGYIVNPPYGTTNFVPENFLTSAQTQVTGINNPGTTVGFWVDNAGDNLGFVDQNGKYTTALDPNAPALGGKTPVTEQFLGVNDAGQVAGFYNDSTGNARGFVYDSNNGSFAAVNVTGATAVTATDINDKGQISGFHTENGATEGFVDIGGNITTLTGPAGATNVQALGINDFGQVVGSFMSGANTEGFFYNPTTSTYTVIDAPHYHGETVINGINDAGQMVGFFNDAQKNVDGLLVNQVAPAPSFQFQTIGDNKDPTFNQLLGINNAGTIAGYFGSGLDAKHPNKGYTVGGTYQQNNFVNENFPTSVQTQVTGINNSGTTVGFWVDGAQDNLGFVDHNNSFTTAIDPNAPALGGTTPVTEQFLGVNDLGQVAGFYNDSTGAAHGFVYNSMTGGFTDLTIAGASSVTATGINDQGGISGFFAENNKTEGFLDVGGKITTLAGPTGASNVQALGLNDEGQVVGSFVDTKGNTEGFLYNSKSNTYTSIVDPSEGAAKPGTPSETVVNGINDLGQMVGFYVDGHGSFRGMLVNPVTSTPAPTFLASSAHTATTTLLTSTDLAPRNLASFNLSAKDATQNLLGNPYEQNTLDVHGSHGLGLFASTSTDVFAVDTSHTNHAMITSHG